MIKSFKKILYAGTLALSVFALAACSNSGSSSDSSADGSAASADAGSSQQGAQQNTGKKVKIGYVINNLNDTFQTYILEAAQKYADENNIEL